MIDLPAGNFLIPDATVLVEAAVFVIVLFVVARWVMPRVRMTLDRRRHLIEENLKAASLAEAAAQKRAAEAAELLREARREARLIIDRAYDQRDYLIGEGMRKGREEYELFTRDRQAAESSRDDELVSAM